MTEPHRSAEAPGIHPDAPEIPAYLVSRLMVATPMYGGLNHDAWACSMMDLRQQADLLGVPLNVVTIRNESLVQRARNTCVAHFLASDATHLLFIDSDIGFPWQAVFRLLAHRRDVVGATYAKKKMGEAEFAFVPLPQGGVTRTGLVEVHSLPTGFLMISRDAISRLIGAHADKRYGVHASEGLPGAYRNHLYAIFDCELEGPNYWSEDYTFCQRWRRLGGQCWLDPHILLEHHGTARFHGHPWKAFGALQPVPGISQHVSLLTRLRHAFRKR
jgi:hypothetical protein